MAELLSVTPVAGQIKPVQGMSLGEMVNVARGAQQYQREGISLTLEQQQEKERQALQQFLARPENFQTEGRMDINKLNAEVMRLAPLTGADVVSKLTGLSTAQTQASQAAQNLTQTQREMIASKMAILGRLGVNDKRVYVGELDLLVKENPNNRELANLVEAYKKTISLLPEGADMPTISVAAANALLSPQQQQQLFAPQAGTASTGAATFQTTTRPSIAGEAPTTTVGQTPLTTTQLAPTQRYERTGRLDVNNREIFNVYGASGRLEGVISADRLPPGAIIAGNETLRPVANTAAPNPPAQQPFTTGQAGQPGGATAVPVQPPGQVTTVPTQPAAPSGTVPTALMRPGETQETLAAANQLRLRSQDAAAKVPEQMFNNNQIIKLADDVITGKGAQFVGNLSGGYAGIPFTSDNATNLNVLGHYMALQTASLAQSSGLGTDTARGIAAEMSGKETWTAPAIKQTARVNRALSYGTELFNQGAQAAFNKSNDPFSVRDFQNKWSQTVDINALRLADAVRNKDNEAIREIVNANGGKDSPKFKALVSKTDAIRKLIGGQ